MWVNLAIILAPATAAWVRHIYRNNVYTYQPDRAWFTGFTSTACGKRYVLSAVCNPVLVPQQGKGLDGVIVRCPGAALSIATLAP